jgi:hypothetical protein
MTKVQLPRDVAEAIENVSRHTPVGIQYDIRAIADNACNSPESDYGIIWHWIKREEGVDYVPEYFAALVNGYKIAESPEDRLRRCYESHKRSNFASDVRFAEGIERTLEIMGAEYPELRDEFIGILDPHRACPDCGQDCIGWVAEGERCRKGGGVRD